MELDPLANDARSSQRRRRLGRDSACLLCGERDSATLIKVHRSLLAEHHVVGRALHATLTVLLCRNCHSKCSATQLTQGIELRDTPDRSLPELLADVLLQLGSFLVALGQWLLSLAARTSTYVGALDDAGFP